MNGEDEKSESNQAIIKLTWTIVLIGLHEKGPSTVQDLANYLSFSKSKISITLKDMQHAELVKITKNPSDMRSVYAKLTKLGTAQALLAKWSVRTVRDELAERIIKLFKTFEEEEDGK
jgi:DNA-binding MarR family transcriptional regulator